VRPLEFIAFIRSMCPIEQTHFPQCEIIILQFLAAMTFPDFKEAQMSGTRTAKSNLGNVAADEEQREAERSPMGQTEERNLDQGLGAGEQKQEDDRDTTARNEQQDLNQGMTTGTHGSVRHGVNWGPAYQTGTAVTKKRVKKHETAKKSR